MGMHIPVKNDGKSRRRKEKSIPRMRSLRMITGKICTALGLIFLFVAAIYVMRCIHDGDSYDRLRDSCVTTGPSVPEQDTETADSDSPEQADTSSVDLPAEDSGDNLVVDYDSLKSQNEDYVGWIHLPTGSSYPIVRGKYTTEYLHRGFDKKYSWSGCIFMNSENSADFSDRNTIIYGHNMRSGSMFGKNHLYSDRKYAESHPYFWIHIRDGYLTCRIFDQLIVRDMSGTYDTEIQTAEEMKTYLEEQKKSSVYWINESGISDDSRVVTLSTCAGTGERLDRRAVQGVILNFTPYQ
jgi:sortase B